MNGEDNAPPALHLLEQYTQKRKALLQRMYVEASKYVLLGDNAYAHAQTLLCGTLVLVAVFGRARGMSLFVFHPIFMNFMVMFMTEGLIVYRNTFAYNALHSIMQFDAKTKYRNLHTGMQVVATAFGALGALFIAANKIQNGKSIMPMSIHSILGTLALVGIITQVLVGFRKRHMIRLNEEMGVAVGPTYRWHGKLGLVTYDLCALSMLTGMLSYLPYTLPNLLVMVTTILTWFITMTHAVLKMRPADDSNSLSASV